MAIGFSRASEVFRMLPSSTGTPASKLVDQPSIFDLVNLERLEDNLYRNKVVFERSALYGGQVAAQALFAAGGTVPADRLPHSLHGYFLGRGDAARPTVFQVECDRDGQSFSARRVVVLQNGEIIFTLSALFARPGEPPPRGDDLAPAARGPQDLPALDHPYRELLEVRPVAAPAGGDRAAGRFWVRCAVGRPASPLLRACVLTYMSDLTPGLLAAPERAGRAQERLDHAVWFHPHPWPDGWVLLDLRSRMAGEERGWYTGALYAADSGRLT
jgi:acyl-CoA thioesterase-2